MAIGIAAINDETIDYAGATPFTMRTITGDANYPAGGYPVTANSFGLRLLGGIDVLANNTAALGYVPSYNSQTGKVQILQGGAAASTPGAEIPAATDVHTFSWTCLIFGQR